MQCQIFDYKFIYLLKEALIIILYILDLNPDLLLLAMLSALDDSVGNITSTLKKRGMLENTIIAFSTDNGGAAHGVNGNSACNWPLR